MTALWLDAGERDAQYLGRQNSAAADYANNNFITKSDRLCRRANLSTSGASDQTTRIRLTGDFILRPRRPLVR